MNISWSRHVVCAWRVLDHGRHLDKEHLWTALFGQSLKGIFLQSASFYVATLRSQQGFPRVPFWEGVSIWECNFFNPFLTRKKFDSHGERRYKYALPLQNKMRSR